MTPDKARIEQLFLDAIELHPDRRAELLRQRCGGAHDELVLREVEALLRHSDEAAPEFLHGRIGTFQDIRDTSGSAPDEAARVPSGARYVPVRVVGEGTFGTVLLAHQESPIQRNVALKVLKAGFDTAELLARFDAERQTLASLEHPNIARIYDAGSTPTGRPFVAMEYVDGEPITSFCDRKHLSIRERLELFVLVCDAVQHAHQKGIVHRDLKPANILVTERDGRPVAKIIDFGVAKAVGGKLSDRAKMTEVGQLIGTLEYMSPEQADIGATDIDTRADIYSLGVILYELLAGVLPVDASSLRDAPLSQVQRILREAPRPRPSTQLGRMDGIARAKLSQVRTTTPAALATALRRELDLIPLKAMRIEREERYRAVAELAQDIDNYLRGRPLLAAPESGWYRARKFVRRNRRTVIAAALVLASLVAGVIGTSLGLLRARRAEAVAVRERIGAEIRLAETRAFQADSLAIEGRLQDAQQLYEQSYEELTRLGGDASVAELGLWHLDQWSSTPLARWAKPGAAGVHSVAFSPDGATAAIGGDNGQIDLRDVRTGTLMRTIVGHDTHVNAVVFSPDGKWLYSAAVEGGLNRCDWRAGGAARVLDPSVRTWNIAMSPDGRLLATGEFNGVVKLRDAATGHVLRTLGKHASYVTGLAFLPDGQGVASASIDHSVQIWTLSGDRPPRVLDTGAVTCIAVSPDGRQLATAGWENRVELWDVSTGQRTRTLSGHHAALFGVAFTPDGKRVVTASSDATVRIWSAQDGRPLRTFRGHRDSIWSLAVSPDGRRALSGGSDGALLWDILGETKEGIPLPKEAGSGYNRCEFSQDGRTLRVDSADVGVSLWDLGTLNQLAALNVEEFAGAVSVGPRGPQQFIISNMRGRLSVWNPIDGTVRPFAEHGGRIWGIAMSNAGTLLVSAGRDGTIKLWDPSRAAVRAEIRRAPGTYAFALTPDGTRLAVCQEGDLQIYDTSSGAAVRSYSVPRAWTWIVCSPDGAHVAAASEGDAAVRVFRLDCDDKFECRGRGSGIVTAASFTCDSSRLWTTTGDGSMNVFDARTGELLRTFKHELVPVVLSAYREQVLLTRISEPPEVSLSDFHRPARLRDLARRAARAAQTLGGRSDDGEALATLAEWFAYRRTDDWAMELMERAEQAGHRVPPLEHAACCWRAGRLDEALRAYQDALQELPDDGATRAYIRLCINAIRKTHE